ncbi:APC family permease [Streptomyces aurantiogriseus]|uniref:Amino acid permease n=1 Tax=Streptomyces aurantiogriseus TaxID=66870 RepID=A0A918BZY7_9ACTN|nr:amino acid permease [Streptomyces aurantiogriseus]GGQ98303.1 amino acid permease [Streptomyces aurantiogriseus]
MPENTTTAPPGLPVDETATAAGQELKQQYTLRSAFALSFSDVSPIVGLYGVFALGIVTAGPAFWWAFPVVLVGQLLVSGVFGELVSRWPLQGSVYQWARHLIGPRYGWFTNWAYMWGLTLALSALSYAASGFLIEAIGIAVSGPTQALIALGVLLFGSAANMIGGRVLKVLLYGSLTAELVATLGIGIVLLFVHREHALSAILSGGGTAHGAQWLFGPFLAAVAMVGWSFVGFESAGSIAEEVKESRRVLPKAMPLALTAVGLLVAFAGLGILLAVPDVAAVLSGKDADPVATTLQTRLGSSTGSALLIALVVGFTASLMAVQAAVSRAIWAGARDRVIPGARLLGTLSGTERVPRNAIALTVVIAGSLLFISASKVYALLLSFANAGFYISYALPVLGAVCVRLRGTWQPGEVSMGRWGTPVTLAAAVWVTFELVNIAWPRALNGVWYLDWGLLIMTGVLGVIGVLVSWWVFRPGRGASPAPALRSVALDEGGA